MEAHDATKRLRRWGAWALVLIPLALQFLCVRSRGIDPDELEHLHAAFCVWNGLLPYRDFFEHHSPAFYYLLQPAFWLCGADLNALWVGRTAMCLMSCSIVAVTWRLARVCSGEFAAWTASLLLAWSGVFVLKGIELRPDVPACLCVTIMLYVAVRSWQSSRFQDWLGIGLIAGVATLFTQKTIVPVISMAAIVVVVRGLQHGNQHRETVSERSSMRHFTFWDHAIPLLAIGLGGAIVWGILAVIFVSQGALHDLLAGAVIQILRLPIQSERWEHLRPAIAADLTLWLTGAAAGIAVCRDIIFRKNQPVPTLIAGTVSGCVLSLIWVKAVYPQYVLLWLPLLAVAGAAWLDRVRIHATTWARLAIGGMGVLICAVECKLLLDGLRGTQSTALSHLRERWNLGDIPAAFALVLPVGLILWAGCLWWRSSTRQWFVYPIAVLGMTYAVARDANNWLWPNRSQVALIERVNSLVAPHDTVLDGFAGYGVLRPHANYFWWINRYSLALMTERDKSKLLESVRRQEPAVILYDHELQLWPPIKEPLETAYQPTAHPPIWIRRAPPSRGINP